MCGLFGVRSPGRDVARLTYFGLFALQHRGQESAGIAVSDHGRLTTLRDGFQIRRAAAERRIPCFTSLDTARAATNALLAGAQQFNVKPLAEYRNGPAPSK